MQLSELVTALIDEMSKASMTSAKARAFIHRALRSLELREDEWEYMFQEDVLTLEANDTGFDTPARLKTIEYVGIDYAAAGGTSTRHYLHKIKGNDVVRVETTLPEGYYFATGAYHFDNIVDTAYTGVIGYFQFTDWSDEDDFEPWLFEKCWPLVLYEACLHACAFYREFEQIQVYKLLWEDAYQNASRLNEELKFSNRPLRMGR